MTAIPKKIVVSDQGLPLEVIIAWSDYQDLAERMGWDLSELELADAKLAKSAWESRDGEEFVSLADLK